MRREARSLRRRDRTSVIVCFGFGKPYGTNLCDTTEEPLE